MIALKILMTVLFTIVTGLILFIVVELLRSYAPYSLFRLHVKLVTKGIYRLERKDDYFKIKSFFVTLEVAECIYHKERIELEVDGGFNNFFRVFYNKEKGIIENFKCSEKFAKGVNNHNMIALLETYIPYVLEQEYGKKSDHVLAIEKMNALSETFQPKTTREKQPHYQLNTPKNMSTDIANLVKDINEVALELQEKKHELEIEEQHQLETLLSKRLPNVLKHIDLYEKEVKEALHDVLHKLRAWHDSLQDAHRHDVEKELLLIKKITQG